MAALKELEAMRRLHPGFGDWRPLEELLDRLDSPAETPPALDRGWVLSLEGSGGGVRGFHDVHGSEDLFTPRAFQAACAARVGRFARALSSLNASRGWKFPVPSMPRVQGRGWPFFGWKARGGRLAATLYLAREASGSLDCLAFTLDGGGGLEAKVYRRGPAPGPAQLGGDAAWWLSLERRAPVRFWTRARRLRGAGTSPDLKWEVHFSADVEPSALSDAPDERLRRSLERADAIGAKVTCLAIEAGRPSVYFRCPSSITN